MDPRYVFCLGGSQALGSCPRTDRQTPNDSSQNRLALQTPYFGLITPLVFALFPTPRFFKLFILPFQTFSTLIIGSLKFPLTETTGLNSSHPALYGTVDLNTIEAAKSENHYRCFTGASNPNN